MVQPHVSSFDAVSHGFTTAMLRSMQGGEDVDSTGTRLQREARNATQHLEHGKVVVEQCCLLTSSDKVTASSLAPSAYPHSAFFTPHPHLSIHSYVTLLQLSLCC